MDLIVEANREIEDVMPAASKKIYNFVGEQSPSFTYEELEILIGDSSWKPELFRKLVENLLYFSILGLERDGQVKYIYDVGYDMEMLRAEIQKFSGVIRYHIHPAFWPALKIGEAA